MKKLWTVERAQNMKNNLKIQEQESKPQTKLSFGLKR
jgi:hypothetical protein